MRVDVRGIEVVGERAHERCGCGAVAAGSAMVGEYAAGSEAGAAAAWDSTAVEVAGIRVL
jgi:hypothetical protein